MCRLLVHCSSTYEVAPPPPIVFTGNGGGSIVTTRATFIDGDGRSTQTPLMAFIDSVGAHHSHAVGVCVPTTLSLWGSLVFVVLHRRLFGAHIGGGGGHSSFGDSTSTTSAVSFTAQELGQLRHLLIASGFSSPGAFVQSGIFPWIL